MRRLIRGLHEADRSAADEIQNGIFLVRVDRAQYRWHAHKPYYVLRFAVLEPAQMAGHSITGRLYCTQKALWKLSWFLRDFGYDIDLLGREEIDEKILIGLHGVLKISHAVVNGTPVLNFDGFAPAHRWEDLAAASPAKVSGSEVA